MSTQYLAFFLIRFSLIMTDFKCSSLLRFLFFASGACNFLESFFGGRGGGAPSPAQAPQPETRPSSTLIGLSLSALDV